MSLKLLQVLRLPCKTSRRCSKCCACQAKRSVGLDEETPSAAPAKQNEPQSAPSAAPAIKTRCSTTQNDKVINRRRTSADLFEGAPSALPALQKEREVLQLHLPCKTKRRPKSADPSQGECAREAEHCAMHSFGYVWDRTSEALPGSAGFGLKRCCSLFAGGHFASNAAAVLLQEVTVSS